MSFPTLTPIHRVVVPGCDLVIAAPGLASVAEDGTETPINLAGSTVECILYRRGAPTETVEFVYTAIDEAAGAFELKLDDAATEGLARRAWYEGPAVLVSAGLRTALAWVSIDTTLGPPVAEV